MSVKDFDHKKILRHLLAKDELSMLNFLAATHYKNEDKDIAVDILYGIKEYIERNVVDYEGISAMYTTVLYNLSKFIGLAGDYSKTIELCDIGIKNCLKWGRCINFPRLLLNKGYALTKQGSKEEATKILEESFYLYRSMGKLQSCENVKQFAIEHGITI